MNHRAFVTGLGAALAAPLSTVVLVRPRFAIGAETGTKSPRIGILSPPEPLTTLDVFRRGLRDLGYAEESGTRIEYRLGQDNTFPGLAAELVALKVDILIAVTPPAIRAAQRATATIPIIMVLSGDPVALGLVKSLGQPDGNTTGVATLTYELSPKRLEVFKQCVPKLREIAVLVYPYPEIRAEVLGRMKLASRSLGVRIHPLEVRELVDVGPALNEIQRARLDGVMVEPSPLTSTSMARIVDFAAMNRLPAIDARRQFPERGGRMSYGIDYAEHVRAGIRYVAKILAGSRPADLPIEQPSKFELVINLKTAKALGLTILPSLLLRADQVIE